MLQVTTTSKQQILEFGEDGSTFSAVETPVSQALWQAWERARQMTVTSGRKCFERRLNQNALSSLTKTLLERFPTASLTSRLLTWKVVATPGRRLIYQLNRSGRYINESGYGLSLITPISTQVVELVENFVRRRMKRGYKNGTTYNTLGIQLIYGLLVPTPTVNDSKNSTLPQSQELCRKGYQGTLVSALIHMGISPKTRLNPELYECLMGYPRGWTIPNGTNVSKSSATQSCRK